MALDLCFSGIRPCKRVLEEEVVPGHDETHAQFAKDALLLVFFDKFFVSCVGGCRYTSWAIGTGCWTPGIGRSCMLGSDLCSFGGSGLGLFVRILDLLPRLSGLVLDLPKFIAVLELVSTGRFVDTGQCLLVGSNETCGFNCRSRKEVSADKAKVGDEFSSLRVGQDEVDELTDVVESLVGVILGLLLRNWNLDAVLPGSGCVEVFTLTGVPDKLLKEFVMVLIVDLGFECLEDVGDVCE